MLTDQMREAFGYDMYGNSAGLLATLDRHKIARGVPRATGTVLCSVCQVTYNLHPPVQGALWATRTCDVGIVKL